MHGRGSYRATVATGDKALYNFGVYRAAAQRLDNHQTIYFHRPAEANVSTQLLAPAAIARAAAGPVLHGQGIPDMGGDECGGDADVVVLYCWATGVRILDDPVPVLLAVLTAFRYWPTVIELGTGNTDVLQLMLICGMLVCARYGRWILYAVVGRHWRVDENMDDRDAVLPAGAGASGCGAASVVFFCGGRRGVIPMIGWKSSRSIWRSQALLDTGLLFSHSVAGSRGSFLPPTRR